MTKQYTYFGQHFDKVLVSGYDEEGVKFNLQFGYRPTMFKRGKSSDSYQTVFGDFVKPVEFPSISSARAFIRECESNNEPCFGFTNYPYVHVYEDFKDMESRYDQFKVLNLDIETDSENGFGDSQKADREITSITLKLFGKPETYIIGSKPYEMQDEELKQLVAEGKIIVRYLQVESEKELLQAIIKIVKHLEPDVITGWNVEMFDIPYIVKRIMRNFGEKEARKLSPYGIISETEVMIFGKPSARFEIVGIPVIDYMATFRKFSFKNFESMKLDYICSVTIGARKLDYSEYGSLAKLYKLNPNKFYDYNVIDVYRVEQLDMKMRFMSQVVMIAHMARVNLVDTFTTVRIWDVLSHNYLLDRNIVVPTKNDNFKTNQIAGGFVKSPQLGKHRFVMSFDVTSLYPHIMMMFNLSPEMYVGKFKPVPEGLESVDFILNGGMAQYTETLKKNKATVTGKGTIFKMSEAGFIPSIMKMLFNMRSQFKKEKLQWEDKLQHCDDKAERKVIEQKIAEFDNKQMAIKILLNSGYGALSNEHFRWYSDDIAESVTLSGQMTIRITERYINKFLNEYLGTNDVDYIIAIDTDSNYVNVQEVVRKKFGTLDVPDEELVAFLEDFAEELETVIINGFSYLYDTLNVADRCLHMKLEAIGSAVWVAKKRYVMSVLSMEGVRYNPPKIKMQGIDAVRSSTPQVCREKIKEAIPLIIAGKQKEVKSLVNSFRDAWYEMPFHTVASPRGVSNIDKWYDPQKVFAKGTPIACRGALLFNHQLRKLGIDREIEPIRSGDKVRFCYMSLPNPTGANVFAAPDEMPEELDLSKYIDYNLQFEKTFLNPIKSIIRNAGIDISDNVDISQFFTSVSGAEIASREQPEIDYNDEFYEDSDEGEYDTVVY